MKIVFNLLLVCVAGVLAFMCYQSIQIPVQFKAEVDKREEVIIQRLKDIRTLQETHRDMYGTYCGSWAELINFAKTDSVKICDKIGSLNDDQLKEGLNEKDAWKYLCNPKKYEKEIKKFNLSKATFSRDTTKVNILKNDSALMARGVLNWIDEIQYVPFAQNRDTFELNLGKVTTASGYEMALFEAKVAYEVYLSGLEESELNNKIQEKKDMDRFPGLQVGDATTANNNAGNWE